MHLAKNHANKLVETSYWIETSLLGGEMNSTRIPIFLATALIVSMLTAVVLIASIHLWWGSININSQILRAHIMCSAFGMLGASMASLRKLYKSLITESTAKSRSTSFAPLTWDFGWILYYITRPMLGAILGATSYLLGYVGFQILTGPIDVKVSNQGTYLFYTIALLCGFSSSQALDRMHTAAKDILTGQKSGKES